MDKLSSENKWTASGAPQAEKVSPAPTAGTAGMSGPSPTSSLADMDCLVCFNKYNIYRVPKLLGCQHAFCAVCLKLILRKEENTWIITCPLCRKNTFVSGGLIRTLPNKEEIMDLLEHPDSCPEVHVSGIGLDSSSWAQSSQDILNRDQTIPADNRLAVQRLVLLLLLLVILTILILPFIYSGMIKWVISQKWFLSAALLYLAPCTTSPLALFTLSVTLPLEMPTILLVEIKINLPMLMLCQI
uniref:Ring finger protein 186 n=1 Tax=Phasianus colchicus TaxID=9054 RepID=A0A669QTF5_PHACC